jgi:hypothetical protein
MLSQPLGVTFVTVEGVGSQAQGGGADTAAETLAVEEVALSAQPLHHIHTLLTEVAGVAATQAHGKYLSHRFLGSGEKNTARARAERVFKGQALAFRNSKWNQGPLGLCHYSKEWQLEGLLLTQPPAPGGLPRLPAPGLVGLNGWA